MNKRVEETPLLYIERNRIFLLACVAVTAGLIWLTYNSIFAREADGVNPRAFFLFVPTTFVFFQTLWYLLNPFAVFFKDKVEIRQSLFHHRLFFYVDVKLVDERAAGNLKVMYNDNEVEVMNLFGIRAGQRALLKEELKKQVQVSLQLRPDDQKAGTDFPRMKLNK